MNKRNTFLKFILSVCLPSLAFASGGVTDLPSLVGYLLSITNVLIPILFALAFIVFFWGVSKFILNSNGSQAEVQKGKNYMMWGILALFILVSARAILTIVSNDFRFGGATVQPKLPE